VWLNPGGNSPDELRPGPSFDILGSFFPAWLACLAFGLLLAVAARWLLLRLHVVIVFPVLTYPSLTALFTFALWLAFFR
jgi:hypothetical protein